MRYDLVVIGGGHAGCEAALAAARLGVSVCLFAISLDSIANCPCNPSIGGTAKGHLVREIDAIGGEMGKVADATILQSRVLNKGKGPAVYSLRAQIDRKQYQSEMKYRLEMQDGLDLRQAQICKIEVNNAKVVDVVTQTGLTYACKAVIIAVGTYLNSEIIIGQYKQKSGPDGFGASTDLSASLACLGIQFQRFKTGTPPRVHGGSIDFSQLEIQHGDEEIVAFSFDTDEQLKNHVCCHLTRTTEKTKDIILKNLHRSPIYGNESMINGVGPRYCPSIEDKIVRFADKESHQIFIEPMGLRTNEFYIQGFSSSMPEEVQIDMLRTLPGFEKSEIMRSAYAIEYDCLAQGQLLPTLQFKNIEGLYGAGQFNGTSGYEEAAAQGLVAGINAARFIQDKPSVNLSRSEAYIGTLIDDVVTKGVCEPYRMMTSRSEYRLILRQDNADLRLTHLGYDIGLISPERYERFLKKETEIKSELLRLKKLNIAPSNEVNDFLAKNDSSQISTGICAAELLKRPGITYAKMSEIDFEREPLSCGVGEQVEIMLKYAGYIRRQEAQAEQLKKLESKAIPKIDYQNINGLRLEARQKLEQFQPTSIGQAARISGVSPADISALILYLNKRTLIID